MKEFDVTITETLKRTVTVRAEDSDQAMDLVHDQHSQSIHVLDADDFDDMTIETVAERDIMLNILLVEPLKPPREVTIPDTLEALQGAVGGHIETLSMFQDAVIICDEEGKLKNAPLNRSIFDEDGERVEIICGSFLIAGLSEESFDSLSLEALEKYKDIFAKPEKFYSLAGKIVSQAIEPPKDKETVKKIEPER